MHQGIGYLILYQCFSRIERGRGVYQDTCQGTIFEEGRSKLTWAKSEFLGVKN